MISTAEKKYFRSTEICLEIISFQCIKCVVATETRHVDFVDRRSSVNKFYLPCYVPNVRLINAYVKIWKQSSTYAII